MTSDGSLAERVRQVLGRVVDAEFTADDSDRLLADMDDIHYDSVTVTECVAAVEDEFGILVDFVEDDVRFHFRTLANVTAMVRMKLEDLRTLAGPAP